MCVCAQEKRLYTYNALNQVSLWGPTDHNILDYAIKEWSGLLSDYVAPRWQLFVDALLHSLQSNEPLKITAVHADMFLYVEEPFTLNTNKTYPSSPQGKCLLAGDSTGIVAKQINLRYLLLMFHYLKRTKGSLVLIVI